MMIHFPGQTHEISVDQPVTTTRVFHTILEAMGVEIIDRSNGEKVSTTEFSLRNSKFPHTCVFSEAYPPDNLITIMEKYSPGLIEKFNCRSTRWAVYNRPYKLIRTETIQDEIFNYVEDPSETDSLLNQGQYLNSLQVELEFFLSSASINRYDHTQGTATNLDDKRVMERLRHLGYIE